MYDMLFFELVVHFGRRWLTVTGRESSPYESADRISQSYLGEQGLGCPLRRGYMHDQPSDQLHLLLLVSFFAIVVSIRKDFTAWQVPTIDFESNALRRYL